MVVSRSDLNDEIERHGNNPDIGNAKKGSKMTPICGTNREETLPRQQFGHKILVICSVINTVNKNLLKVEKCSQTSKFRQVATLKVKHATTQTPGLKFSSLKPVQKILRLKVAMSCILKTVGVISKVTDTLIKNNKPEKHQKSKP